MDATGLVVLDLPATFGSSGSPVYNARGEVIGLLKARGLELDPFTYAASLVGTDFSGE